MFDRYLIRLPFQLIIQTANERFPKRMFSTSDDDGRDTKMKM